MGNEQLQFRTAAFGGFQKQDVLDYLEKSARERDETLAALQRELEECKGARTEAEESFRALQGRLAELEEKNSWLLSEVADREESLSLAKNRADALESQLTTLRVEMDRLIPAAQAYAGLKDRTAGIELEAHTRAQSIEAESRQKVQKLRKELLAWFDRMEESYTRLQGEMDTAIGRAAGELIRAGRELEGMPQGLKGQEEALKTLRAQAEALEPREPKPFPMGAEQ